MRESSDQVTARRGFFPVVMGHDVQVQDAGGLIYIAKQHLHVSRGGGQWLVAGRDQTIEQGGGAILLSRHAHVSQGVVGLLVAGRVTMDGGARALLTVSVPVAAAAAAGFLAGLLLGRRRAA